MTINRFLKFHYLRFLRLKGTPEEVALGIAIGTFIGITPTIPFHTALILSIALILKANKVAGLLASWLVSNPLTFFPQYYFSWRLGSFFLPYDVSWSQIQNIMAIISDSSGFQASLKEISMLGGATISVMIVGGTILAIPFTITSYYAALFFFSRRKGKPYRMKLKNREKISLKNMDENKLGGNESDGN